MAGGPRSAENPCKSAAKRPRVNVSLTTITKRPSFVTGLALVRPKPRPVPQAPSYQANESRSQWGLRAGFWRWIMSTQVPAAPEPQIKAVAVVQLVTILALALSTLIAVTAVSIGLARAELAPNAGAASVAISIVSAHGVK